MDDAPALRILVLGAYGLIGGVVADRLALAGHRVTGLGRAVAAPALARPHVAWVARDIATCRAPADWAPVLAGIDVVVNCAGALQDGPRDDVRAVQAEAMVALFAACAPAGVRRIVQVSAAGATPDAPTEFMRSKAEADAALAACGVDWVVLRPGLVLAAEAYGATALLRALAAWPRALPLPLPLAGARVQTVDVAEVADAVLAAAEARIPMRRAYDLVEDAAQTLAGLLAALRAWTGRAPLRLLPAPALLGRAMAAAGDAVSRLGWRPPLRSTALAEIGRGVTGDPGPWRAATGRGLRPLAETLRRRPATVQDRWFGRLWLLKPLLVGGLSAFWLASGALALASPAAAASVLTARGMAEGPALALVVAGAAVDLVLGAAVLARRFMAPAALGMVATSLAYLAGGTLLAPDLWADPLGPLVKVVPAMLPALVLLATAEDR
ncbi:SDR family oxidoreductase [Roseomonas sp. HF4]|uniref:SDR family oxidoreductase n=1 Tax=Roseomonas sp. HF4 TaxID=2562313 RepID=UPI0010C107E8|nr:SDR family oxidoreductase [Roseomonas sp. HF4]